MKRALESILIIAAAVTGFLLNKKRALTLSLIIAVVVVGFLAVRGTMPFMAIYGTSMEPEFTPGDLILIEEISPSEVKEGDGSVYTVPRMTREVYNYPVVVAHRVVEVHVTERGTYFRTRGDNSAGEDPFTVRPEDLKGQVSSRIPYLGFPLLFMQSDFGLIFIIIGLCLLALYLYAGELSRGRQTVQRGIFAPVIEENQRSSRVLERRIGTAEQGMVGTQQALNNFAGAISEYAEHLKSHTSAIQSLSEASQELKKGAAEQNKVLIRLVETMEQGVPRKEEVISKEVEEVAPEAEKIKFPPGCVRSRQRHIEEEEIFRAG
jgi:signal peptidase I